MTNALDWIEDIERLSAVLPASAFSVVIVLRSHPKSPDYAFWQSAEREGTRRQGPGLQSSMM